MRSIFYQPSSHYCEAAHIIKWKEVLKRSWLSGEDGKKCFKDIVRYVVPVGHERCAD